MIPSLKQAHEARLKRHLLEMKNNPELLQEFYDQQQLEDMSRAIKKLAEIFKKPEFRSLSSFHMAIQKAHAELDDTLERTKLGRAIRLGSEMKRVSTLIVGISKLFKQLPPILDLAKGRMPAEWDPDEPISSIMDKEGDPMQAGLKRLRKRFVKAMKPGIFGISDLPYMNTREAANELLNLSVNHITKLKDMIGASHIMKQTISNPSFIEKIADRPSEAEPRTKSSAVKLSMPGAAEPRSTGGQVTLNTLKQSVEVVFRLAARESDIDLDSEVVEVSNKQLKDLERSIILYTARWMDKKGLVNKSKS